MANERTLSSIEETLQSLVDAGISPEQIAERAKRLAAKRVKDYFLDELIVPDSDPAACTIQASVSSWSLVNAFFAKAPTEEIHPQRIYQELRSDIADAIAQQDAQKLVLSLLLTVKAIG